VQRRELGLQFFLDLMLHGHGGYLSSPLNAWPANPRRSHSISAVSPGGSLSCLGGCRQFPVDGTTIKPAAGAGMVAMPV
ncbi:MAG: hypothetical protein KDI67_08725, partial [Gammaproteobacteria bacterium]|nr:hypothetical protein [Gammaproteobacteria bacterium]